MTELFKSKSNVKPRGKIVDRADDIDRKRLALDRQLIVWRHRWRVYVQFNKCIIIFVTAISYQLLFSFD